MEEDKEIKRERIYKVVMLVILVAFITFMVTSAFMYTHYTKNPAYKIFNVNSNANLENTTLPDYLSSIEKSINEKFLWNDKVDETKLKEGAIKGYVEALGDEYSEYISKDEMKKFTENIIGSFVGIGVYMVADQNTNKILVYYPIPESPAEKAGVLPGDIIKSVDGVEYPFEEFETLAAKIRGEAGTKVKLVVEREGKDISFEIVREKVTTNPIVSKIIDKNIGYIQIPSFDDGTAKAFKEKLNQLQKDGAESLIIDLRNNGGGIVDESTEIADLFLDKNLTIITTRDNKDNKEITKSQNEKYTDMKVIVLANGNSASASEILIGALKDNKRATIVGTTTYGKGVIQTVYTLSDGSGLKMTTAEYYTPSDKAIHKIGIDPDIEVKLSDEIENLYSIKQENDEQLKKAIEELKK